VCYTRYIFEHDKEKQEARLSQWEALAGCLFASAPNKLRPFNKLSSGVSHMQINAAVSEAEHLEHRTIESYIGKEVVANK